MNSNLPAINPYAPSAYLGMREVLPEYTPETFAYTYDVVLTANQVLSDSKSTDTDSDFIWQAITIPLATGSFTLRLGDSRMYYLSDSRIASTIYTANDPYPIVPALIIPAGGRIVIDIADTSGAGNTIQIVFLGAKRYPKRR